MDVKVQLSNIRIAPLKVRRVADLIRGKKTDQAQALLSYTVGKPSLPILKLLNSALATAKNDFKLDENNLFVSRIMVDEGPKLKRSHPMSRGRAYPILKRSSHVVLILSELKPTVRPAAAEKKAVKMEKAPAKKEATAKKPAPKKKATKKQ